MNIHTERKDITFLYLRDGMGRANLITVPCWKFDIPHYTTVKHPNNTKLCNVVYSSVKTMTNAGCGYGIKNKDIVINK